MTSPASIDANLARLAAQDTNTISDARGVTMISARNRIVQVSSGKPVKSRA